MNRRVLLAIEISNPTAHEGGPWAGTASTGVALARGGAILGGPFELLCVESLAPDKGQDDDLLPAIDRACARAGVRPRDVGVVGVSVGPGGFTALRMAISAAKMMSDALGAACVGVPSAQVVAQQVSGTAPFAVALASKGEDSFATCFEPRGDAGAPTPRGDGQLLGAAGLASLGVARLIADQYLPQSMREEAARLGMVIKAPRFDAGACALLASMVGQPIDPLQLAPIYPREPEAVVKWRALKAKRAATP
ncbi:MAG: hypothetical protein SFY96_09815 [Planctomycetota bacterium]|nr:hypothetical protein [Planctomycetota bacterium]